MYYCNECNKKFLFPVNIIEFHGLDTPPYEKYNCCPYCNSTDFMTNVECCICGETIKYDYVKLITGDYVCDNCYTTGSVGD